MCGSPVGGGRLRDQVAWRLALTTTAARLWWGWGVVRIGVGHAQGAIYTLLLCHCVACLWRFIADVNITGSEGTTWLELYVDAVHAGQVRAQRVRAD